MIRFVLAVTLGSACLAHGQSSGEFEYWGNCGNNDNFCSFPSGKIQLRRLAWQWIISGWISSSLRTRDGAGFGENNKQDREGRGDLLGVLEVRGGPQQQEARPARVRGAEAPARAGRLGVPERGPGGNRLRPRDCSGDLPFREEEEGGDGRGHESVPPDRRRRGHRGLEWPHLLQVRPHSPLLFRCCTPPVPLHGSPFADALRSSASPPPVGTSSWVRLACSSPLSRPLP